MKRLLLSMPAAALIFSPPSALGDPGATPRFSAAELVAEAAPESIAAATPGVELVYFHATLRCETCLALEASIERCLREEFATEMAEGWIRWRSLDYQSAAGEGLHAELGVRGSELVLLRYAGSQRARWEPIRSVWQAPSAAAVCDSLRPLTIHYLREFLAVQDSLDAQVLPLSRSSR